MAGMDHAAFGQLLTRMTGGICAGDVDAATACFAPDGVYHDGFYGEFRGRAEIARMLREFFYRDATDFEWRVFDPACDGRVGYARYEFSYRPTIAGAPRTRRLPGHQPCRARRRPDWPLRRDLRARAGARKARLSGRAHPEIRETLVRGLTASCGERGYCI